MGSLNRVTIIGRLGADPELKFTSTSKAVCNLRVATSERMKDKTEKTEWHSIVIWGDQGENAAKYLAKGREVCIEGRLQTRTWEKEGQKHYRTDVVADRVVFLGGGDGPKGARGGADQSHASAPNDPDDDIAF